jgi:L-lactate dehydrogenase (cytochrome)
VRGLVGRAYLYGLMAGGERGVQRVADLLTREITRTLQLLGVPSVAELTPDRVRLRHGTGWLPSPPAPS